MLVGTIAASLAMQASASQVVRVPLHIASEQTTIEVPEVQSFVSADEIIVSVNCGGGPVRVEVRPSDSDRVTGWYDLGTWALDGRRTSVNGQNDADGQVLTDTLRLTRATNKLGLRFTVESMASAREGCAYVCFSSKPTEAPKEAGHAVEPIPVPQYAQGDFPGGEVLCSPTSLSMVLNYWAAKVSKPEWAKSTTEITKQVYDPAYKGAGNWAFNVAYAGSLPGLTAFVARMDSLTDAQKWLRAGIPVICSVASTMLDGGPLGKKETGHLLVLVGLTGDGDPITNNPSHRAELRKIYKRENFERAWIDRNKNDVALATNEADAI